MTQTLKSLRVDLIMIALLLMAGLKFTFGVENVVDIPLYDESDYLYRGVTLWRTGFLPAELSPLYSIWYFILSFFEPDRVMLFFLNYRLMLILPSIFLYILLRKNTVSIPISLMIAWLFLVTPPNRYIGIRVSSFGLMMILATFLLMNHKRSLLWNSFIASIGALLVSYVRPEYFLTYILCSLLFLFSLVRQSNPLERPYALRLLGTYVLCSVFLLGMLKIPVGGSRSMAAFGQHFSVHWVAWTGSSMNPWTTWWEILPLNFGSAQSIPEAFANNPTAFLLHIRDNLRTLGPITAHLIFPVDFFLSRRVMILFIIGMLILYMTITRYKRYLVLVEYKRLLLFFGLFVFTGLVAIIIIYPQNHYIVLPGVLTVVMMSILLTNHDLEQEQTGYKQLLLISFLVVVLTPMPFLRQNPEKPQRPTLSTIRFIQSLGIDESVNLLEAAGGYDIYLGDNFHRVAEYSKGAGFHQFRADYGINMIVVSDALLHDTRFINDPEWQSFLTDYHQFGYLQKKIPDTDMNLILLADLIQN